jgi:5-methyltetrahydropteroyltriglutamate--homocysteine methyltransferase
MFWPFFSSCRIVQILTSEPPGERPLITQGRDREAFADFYRYATERGTLFYAPGEQIKRVRPLWYCTEPVTYRGSLA